MTDESKNESAEHEIKLGQADAALDQTVPSEGAAPSAVLCAGQVVLEKYRIIELLGRGGMGCVYRVENLLVNRVYALKCLSRAQTNDSSWRRFQNEVKAAHLLDHANLIRVYDFGLLPGGQPYFLMELVDGPTLSDEIKKRGKIDLLRALRIFIHVTFAIQYAHDHRVVHRDLKPSNIMLARPPYEGEEEIVKVVDFGIAKLTGVDEFNQQTLTKTGEIFGSPLYMSPEQCMGIAVDHRSDLYSLGCVFYETLTGAPPFIGDSALSTMLKHQSENALSLKEASLGEDFPEQMQRIIETLLEKDPNKRYQSAQKLAEDLIALDKTLRLDEVKGVQSAFNNVSQKLDEGKEKLALTSNIYTTILACSMTFVLGLALCYWIISRESVAPQISFPKRITNALVDEKKLDVTPAPKPAENLKVSNWAVRSKRGVVFHFPESHSLGRLELQDGKTLEARGIVSIPANKPVALIANSYLLNNPVLLDGFAPHDLQALSLNGIKLIDPGFYTHLHRLKGLKLLNLSGTDFGSKDLLNIAGLTDLLYLNVGATGVSCDDILQLPILANLRCLDITAASGAGALAARVASLPNLKMLVIAASDISDDELKNLARSKSLKVLCLAHNGITNRGLKNLLALKTLEWIDLTKSGVKPDCCKILAKMPALKKIEIGSVLSNEEERNFEQYINKERPDIKMFFSDQNTVDLESCLPESVWSGNCIRSFHPTDLSRYLELPKR